MRFAPVVTSSATEVTPSFASAAAVDLDGFLRHAKLTADLLIQHSCNNELHHLELARGQQITSKRRAPYRWLRGVVARQIDAKPAQRTSRARES